MSDKMDNSPPVDGEPTPPARDYSDMPSAAKYSMPYDEIVAAMNEFVTDHKKAVAAKMRDACDEITKRNELYPMGYPQDLANSLANMQHLSNLLDPPVVVGPGVMPMVPGPGVGPGNV